MGKTIRAQKFGKSPMRRSPSHRFIGEISYPMLGEGIRAKVADILHDSGRTAPVAVLRLENGESFNLIATVGLSVGDEIIFKKAGETKEGYVMPLRDIPEGTLVSNVEITPGDGGSLSRTAGTFCRIVTHDQKGTVLQLPSGNLKTLNSGCLATVGIVAGGGREEKPMLKAGKHHHLMKARNRLWPVVKGVNMNPVDHPFGGGGHPHTGKPKTVSRHAPPGRKIGSIAARRTGKKR